MNFFEFTRHFNFFPLRSSGRPRVNAVQITAVLRAVEQRAVVVKCVLGIEISGVRQNMNIVVYRYVTSREHRKKGPDVYFGARSMRLVGGFPFLEAALKTLVVQFVRVADQRRDGSSWNKAHGDPNLLFEYFTVKGHVAIVD